MLFLNNDTRVTRGLARSARALSRRSAGARARRRASSSIPMVACRKPAASSSATHRAGITAASRIRTIRATRSGAKWTTVRAPRSCCAPSCSAGSAASTRATRPRITKTPISPSRCARRDTRSTTSRLRPSCISKASRRAPTPRPASSASSRSTTRNSSTSGNSRLRGNPRRACRSTRAASHRATRRVLIVDATTPTPDQDSGSLRMVNLMRVLGDLGCRTTFLPDNRLWDERYTPALQELGVEALYAPWTADPVKFFRERGAEFDAIVLSRHYVAASYRRPCAPVRAAREAHLRYGRSALPARTARRRARRQSGAHATRGCDARAGAEADPRMRCHARRQLERAGTAGRRCAGRARRSAVERARSVWLPQTRSANGAISCSSAVSSIRRTWTR